MYRALKRKKYLDRYNRVDDCRFRLHRAFNTASGGKALLFGIFTLGIYNFYWYYMLGKKVGDMQNASSDGGLYLFLFIFLLGFVAKILAQNAINRTVARASTGSQT